MARRLTERGFEVYVPLVSQVRQWHDRRKVVQLPLFPSYVFTRCEVSELGTALATPGLVRIVTFDGNPASIPAAEIESIRLLASRLPADGGEVDMGPVPRVGDTVHVVRGPLRGIRGVVAEYRAAGRVVLVVGVTALDRGIRVEVERAHVQPAGGPQSDAGWQ